MSGLIPEDYAQTEMAQIGVLQQLTMTERLDREKTRLEAQLENINTALEALKKNPEVQAAVDAIVKLGHF